MSTEGFARRLVHIGGLSVVLALGAVLINRRRLGVLTNTGITQSEAPSFTFRGAPSAKPSVAAPALRAVGVVTDLLGIDFGTQIAPLMAFARPPSFIDPRVERAPHRGSSVRFTCLVVRSLSSPRCRQACRLCLGNESTRHAGAKVSAQ
jgi:hypothetical protein